MRQEEVQAMDSGKDACNDYHDSQVFCPQHRQFISQKLPPIQFKNPNVQVVLFKNEAKFPNVKIYYSKWRKVLIYYLCL